MDDQNTTELSRELSRGGEPLSNDHNSSSRSTTQPPQQLIQTFGSTAAGLLWMLSVWLYSLHTMPYHSTKHDLSVIESGPCHHRASRPNNGLKDWDFYIRVPSSLWKMRGDSNWNQADISWNVVAPTLLRFQCKMEDFPFIIEHILKQTLYGPLKCFIWVRSAFHPRQNLILRGVYFIKLLLKTLRFRDI